MQKLKSFLKGPTLYAFAAGVAAGIGLSAVGAVAKMRDDLIAKIHMPKAGGQ